jgi:glucose dehydrogenase
LLHVWRRLALLRVSWLPRLQAQTDWPLCGRDAGGIRYSRLKQITPENVAKL